MANEPMKRCSTPEVLRETNVTVRHTSEDGGDTGAGGGVEGAPPGREEWDVARPTGDSWRCAPWGGPGKPRHVATRTPVRSERGGGGGPAHPGTARDRQTAVTATGWAAPRGRCGAEGPRGTANVCTKC